MHVPVPLLIAAGFLFLLLLGLAVRRRGSRDLIAPPRDLAPRTAPSMPSGAVGPDAGSGLPSELDREVRLLLRGGRKIEAIKRVREETGLGLAEAKERVERIAEA